jgi:type III secretory pathway component EscU
VLTRAAGSRKAFRAAAVYIEQPVHVAIASARERTTIPLPSVIMTSLPLRRLATSCTDSPESAQWE